MYYHYIEIGTSNFETAIDVVKSDEIALLIEPIKHYLDSLPSKKNVVKMNCAISPTKEESVAQIYYIPEKIIIDNKLPFYLKGCNSINQYHPLQLQYKNFVVIEDIPCLPLEKAFEQCNVEGVQNVKIDTEGCDFGIMLQLVEWLRNRAKENYPKVVKYETCYANTIKNRDHQDIIIKLMTEIGYTNYTETQSDTIFTL